MKFSELNLHPSLIAGIKKNDFVECTPIQEKAIPLVLDGKDVAGLAQTGTGKTAAFVLPLIERILRAQEMELSGQALRGDEILEAQAKELELSKEESGQVDKKTRAVAKRAFLEWEKSNYILVLVPTRELAEQVYQNVRSLGTDAGIRCTAIYGGTAYEKQKRAIGHGLEFVIATPGRLIDLYKEHIVDLRQVRAVVFDEADRMFDMGFKDDMKYILQRIPNDRQMLVFSATLNFDVLNVCYEFGSEPVEINISKDQPKAENVNDKIFHVGHDEKPMYLLSLLQKEEPRQAIVFSNFKRNVERITQFLNKNQVPAVGISSLMTQAQRNRVMDQFKSENERNILVATDLAARGLDIQGVDAIFNFELPDDPENYVHRIGRTGRAGAKGHAYSFVGEKDVDALGRIEDYLGHKLDIGWLEDKFLLTKFTRFPKERELNPYPKTPRYLTRKKSNRGSFHRNNKSQERGGKHRDAKAGRGDDSQHSGGRPQHKRNYKKKRYSSREQGTENQEAGTKLAGSTSPPRKRTTGHHNSASAQRRGAPKNKSPHRYRKAKGSQGRQQKASARNKQAPPKSPPETQKSFGKKVSSFIKKLFNH